MIRRAGEPHSFQLRAALVATLAVGALAALVAGGSALAAGVNVTGTWHAVYDCTAGSCAGETYAETLTLSQAQASSSVSGTDNIGGSVAGSLSGSTLTLTETDGSYKAYFSVTISTDGGSWSGTLSDSNGTSGTDTASREQPASNAYAPVVTPSAPAVRSSTSASVSGSVNPNGTATRAEFQYGLDPKYSGGGPVTYTQSTAISIPADSTAQPVSARLSGLVPNALYHVRLVATNGSGTTDGPDQTFQTLADPAPPPPVLGKTENVAPVSGIVYIKLPVSAGYAVDPHATITKGEGFIPLTEARQIPSGSQIDARRGTLDLLAAPVATQAQAQRVTLGGAIVVSTQSRTGLTKGLTTISLLEGAFRGAPSFATCPKVATDGAASDGAATDSLAARAAKASPKVLQTLKASDDHGRFATRGRYSSASVLGTQWTTSDRCGGTFTAVQRGTVDVFVFATRKTIPVYAGYSYYAKAVKGINNPY